MISLFTYVCIALVGLIVLPMRWSDLPYTQAKQTFLCLSAYILLGLWLFFDRTCAVNPQLVPVILLMFGWWFLRSATCDLPRNAYPRFVTLLSVAVLGIFLANPQHRDFGLLVFVSFASINAVYAIFQNAFKINLIRSVERQSYSAVGFMARSQNFVAPYFVVALFLSLYLLPVFPWVFLCAGLLFAAICLTRNRAGYIGLAAGAIYLFPYLALGLPALYFLKGRGIKESFTTRKLWWWLAWEQFKKTPVLGLGFDNFKAKAPVIQRYLDYKTNGKYFRHGTDIWLYKPDVVHSYLIQQILELGLLGLAMIGYLIFQAFSQAAGVSPFLVAAFVAIIVNGLFIDLWWYFPATGVLFWLLLGILNQAGVAPWTFELTYPIIAAYLGLGFLIFKHILIPQYYDVWKGQYLATGAKNEALLVKLLKRKYDAKITSFGSQHYFAKGDLAKSLTLACRNFYNFDGSRTIWDILSNMGILYFWAGSPGLAKRFHEEALSFFPYSLHAKQGLAMADNALEQLTKASGGNANEKAA